MSFYKNISLSASQNKKYFRQKSYKKIKTHILCSVTLFPKIVPFMRKCGKIWKGQAGHR